MDMKLYYAPGTCSLSPHIVAREAGLPVELVAVDLKTHRTRDGRDYTRINPRGYVPALELDDGTLLREGPALVQFLADRAPTAGLLPPAGSLERVRVQEWLTYVGTELHKQFHWLFHPSPEATRRAQRERIEGRLRELEEHFATHVYLTREGFSVADAYAFTVLRWCGAVGIDLAPYPNVRGFMERVGSRPSVREALAAEGLE
jgi:glutathione S-transferase